MRKIIPSHRKAVRWGILVLLLMAGYVFRDPLMVWGKSAWAGLSGQTAEDAQAGPLIASGVIEAQELDVASPAGGRIVALHVTEGQQMAAGELVADIDTALLDAQEAEARAAVSVAQAQVALLKAGVREADLDVARAAVGQAEVAAAAAKVASDDAQALIDAPGQLDVRSVQANAALQVAAEQVTAAEAGATAADLEQQLWGRIVQRLAQGADVSLPPQLGGETRHVDAPAEQLAEARLQWNLKSQAAWEAHAKHNAALAARDAAHQTLTDLQTQRADPLTLQGQAAATSATAPVADAAVEMARANMTALSAGAPAEQIGTAEATVVQAQAALVVVEAKRPQFQVLAPQAGTITDLVLQEGEVAAPGASIARLADLQVVTLTAYVPEPRMSEVRVGGSAAVAVDAFPGRTFAGAVTLVAGAAEFTPKNVQTRADRANTVFAVKITLPNPDGALKAGMPADAAFCAGADPCNFPFAAAASPAPGGVSALLSRVAPESAPTPENARRYSGPIEANEVHVAAEVGGRVVAVLATEGDPVAAEQVLVTLEGQELAAKRAQVEAAVATAKAELARVEAKPQPERVAQAEAGMAQAEAALRAAQARLDAARQQLEQPQELDAQINSARQQVRTATAAIDVVAATVKSAQVLQESLPNPGSDEDRTRRALYDAQATAAAAFLRAARAQEQGAKAVLAQLLAMRQNPVALEAAVHKAEGDVRAAEAAVTTARARLAQVVAGPHGAAVALATARVAQAEAGLKSVDAALTKLQIRTPITGQVTVQGIHTGEVVAAGAPMFTVADLRTARLTVYVPIGEIGAVRLGQEAEVVVDAYPGRTFAGTVTRIAEQAEFTPKNVQTTEERARMVIAVELTLANADGALRAGMGAEANW